MKRKRHTLTTGPSAHTLFFVPIVSWATPALTPSGLKPGDIIAFPVTTSHHTTSAIIDDYVEIEDYVEHVKGCGRRRRDRGG